MPAALRQYLDAPGIPLHVPEIVLRTQSHVIPSIVDNTFVAYVSGALTGVSEDMKQRYVRTKEIIEGHGGFAYVPHINGTDPVKHPDVTPRDVRDIDEFWSRWVPDFQITWVDPPALGSGIEAGWGETNRVPIVALYPAGTKVSRLMRGLGNYATGREIQYASLEDAYSALDKLASELNQWINEAEQALEVGRDPLSLQRVPVREFFDANDFERRLARRVRH